LHGQQRCLCGRRPQPRVYPLSPAAHGRTDTRCGLCWADPLRGYGVRALEVATIFELDYRPDLECAIGWQAAGRRRTRACASHALMRDEWSGSPHWWDIMARSSGRTAPNNPSFRGSMFDQPGECRLGQPAVPPVGEAAVQERSYNEVASSGDGDGHERPGSASALAHAAVVGLFAITPQPSVANAGARMPVVC